MKILSHLKKVQIVSKYNGRPNYSLKYSAILFTACTSNYFFKTLILSLILIDWRFFGATHNFLSAWTFIAELCINFQIRKWKSTYYLSRVIANFSHWPSERIQGCVSKWRWSDLCRSTHQIVRVQVMAVISGVAPWAARRAMSATPSVLDLVVVVLEKKDTAVSHLDRSRGSL